MDGERWRGCRSWWSFAGIGAAPWTLRTSGRVVDLSFFEFAAGSDDFFFILHWKRVTRQTSLDLEARGKLSTVLTTG